MVPLAFRSPDVPRARQMINTVIEREPNRPEFLDTLGHIQLAQKEWQAAVESLERALNTLPPDPERHEALAKAYDELGLSAIAEKHRRLASEIRANSSVSGNNPR